MSITISSLPTELILEIFGEIDDPFTLGKMQRVCKHWKIILDSHPFIWKELLAKVDPNTSLSDKQNPKSILVARLTNITPYIEYPELNANNTIISNKMLKSLIELIPPIDMLVAAVWNYRNRIKG